MGATNGNSNQYQAMSTQSVGGGPFPRISPSSTNQAILAPLAPRPSPPTLQHETSIEQPLDAHGLSNNQYALFGYTFDGQAFSENDLPPRMRQDQVPETKAYEESRPFDSRVGTVPLQGFQSLPHPTRQPISHGDSDSHIDVGHPACSSEWSYSSASSTGPPMLPAQPNQIPAGIGHAPNSLIPTKHVGSVPQDLFPPQSDQPLSEGWLNTSPDNYENASWTNFELYNDQQQYGSVPHGLQPSVVSPTVWYGMQGVPQEINGMRQL